MPTRSVQKRLQTRLVLPGSRAVGSILFMALPRVKSDHPSRPAAEEQRARRAALRDVVAYPGLRARNVTPVVSKFLADDSCLEPEKTSIFLPHWTSTNPAASRTHSHSASSRAPAIQPDQRSISSLADCGTSI